VSSFELTREHPLPLFPPPSIRLCMSITVLTPVESCAVTFITYALLNDKNILTASDIFTTLVLFCALRFPINYSGKLMGKAVQGLEACQRIAVFSKGRWYRRGVICTRRGPGGLREMWAGIEVGRRRERGRF